MAPGWAAVSDAQLTGLTEDNLEDGHERRCLTEVAGADDVRVDAQPFRVVPRLNALGNAVQTVDDGWGKLKQRDCMRGLSYETPRALTPETDTQPETDSLRMYKQLALLEYL